MSSDALERNWRISIAVSVVLLVLAILIAVFVRLWVLTAIPIGFLFGFFLQKGGLCGSSAFSEVLLFRDWRKMWGLWVCVATGMAGFAVLDALGCVKLNPKPFIWGNQLLGGALFGVGMVLAGGCVSGCLFKAGSGNLNSMVALLGIALGVSLIEHGPLNSFHSQLKTLVFKASDGGSITFSSITGFPFWILAAFFGVATIAAAFALKLKKKGATAPAENNFSFGRRVLTRSWKPWQAGLLIGLLGSVAYLSSAASGRNYPLGVTHGVLHAKLLITDSGLNHVFEKKPAPDAKSEPKASTQEKEQASIAKTQGAGAAAGKKVSWWLVALVVSLVLGSWVSAGLSGEARLLPKPPEQIAVAFLGGLLVGAGAAMARGCVVGNIMSGWALMSVGCVVFGVIALLANWATTYFYLMAGGIRRVD